MKKTHLLVLAILFSNILFAQVFTSSNLPIVVINTNNLQIPDEPKITVTMGIIYNGPGLRNNTTDPFNNYNGKIGIELRGNYSQTFPQKCFSIETRDALDSAQDVSLLNMPAENDWILYAPYSDKSLLRNVTTFKIASEIGNYAVRSVFCELVLNGSYQGIYVLMEKIKRGANRVKVSKLDLDDNAGDSLTGGYIFKQDWGAGVQHGGWASAYNGISFQYHYPYTPTVQQKNYIKLFVDSFENALNGVNYADPLIGYKKYIDVTTFIDFIIMNEFTKNWDGYVASNFFHKEKITDGGKIKAGPIWDYNISFGNLDWCAMHDTTGWIYPVNFCRAKMDWFEKLMNDTNFVNKLKCRWDWVRYKNIPNGYLNNYLDSMTTYLNESQQRHFVKWPLLGTNVISEPQPLETTFQGEINYMKRWLDGRLNWMDSNMPGTCYNVSVEDGNTIANNAYISTYPNPFDNKLTVNYFLNETTEVEIQLVNSLGQIIKTMDCGTKTAGDYNQSLTDFSNLPSGVYMLRVLTATKAYNKTIIKY
jgi:hypothetical protein